MLSSLRSTLYATRQAVIVTTQRAHITGFSNTTLALGKEVTKSVENLFHEMLIKDLEERNNHHYSGLISSETLTSLHPSKCKKNIAPITSLKGQSPSKMLYQAQKTNGLLGMRAALQLAFGAVIRDKFGQKKFDTAFCNYTINDKTPFSKHELGLILNKGHVDEPVQYCDIIDFTFNRAPMSGLCLYVDEGFTLISAFGHAEPFFLEEVSIKGIYSLRLQRLRELSEEPDGFTCRTQWLSCDR